jgi:Flp pilus assembly protein TadG
MIGLRNRLKAFLGASRGNVTTIIGVLAVPLVAAIGGGIDFSNVNKVRTQLQDASDAAVLAAAWSTDKTETGMKTVADRTLNDNIAGLGLGAVTTRLSKTEITSGSVVSYTATVNVPTIFIGVIGVDNIPIQTLSKSDATVRNTEIAFVLDSTGSMASSSKMTNLKSSVDSMLAGLLDASGQNSANTKVTVVPFDTQIKIAPATDLSYIDYGHADRSETCTSTGIKCNVILDIYDKVCKTASNVLSCKATAKLYYRTFTASSKTYYEGYATAYEPGYQTYTYSLKVTPLVGTPSSCSTTDSATGITSTNACPASQWITVQSGSKASTPNLTLYNAAPANGSYTAFSTVAQSFISYPITYVGGYDYYGPQSLTAFTGVYTGAGLYTVDGVLSTANALSLALGDTRVVNKPETTENKAAWLGCVSDRTQSFDVSADTATSANANSLYPARPCSGTNLESAIGLSTDISTARAKVQSLDPAGNTNITIGMQWGMEMLSPDLPFSGGSAWKTPLYTKYLILVTDGDNTQNRWTSTTSEIDARTALVCTAAKDKGIIVYTVRVMAGNSTLLRTCASQTSYFYDLSTAAQLSTTMTNILKSIRKIRLSQ